MEPKHKAREVKRKTVFDRLKESALFVLFMIIVFIVDIVIFVNWLSGVLSSKLTGKGIFTDSSFYSFAGISLCLVVFFFIAWLVQRRAHGS